MNDMSSVIVPKSDQINADDLQGRTMTVTITDVAIRGGQEQPVSISISGTDKVWRPCKTMCRVLVKGWGLDAKEYVGKSLTLYCDPTVKFGPLAVGGIRISHMSHIGQDFEMALAVTKGVKKPYKVRVLKVEAQEVSGDIEAARDAIANAPDLDALKKVWTSKAMAPFRDQLQADLDARKAELLFDSTHATAGEPTTLAQALDEIAKAVNVDTLGELVAAHKESFPDDATAIASAGMARSRVLMGEVE